MNRRRRPEDIPERLLARLWRNRDWRRRSLHLAGGQRLRVLYPGRPGGGPGPDFRDAILQVDALAPVRGDVEFHRVPRGWREHGHHLDPRYNGVVLHVVARVHGGKPSQRQDGREVPVVELIQKGWEAERAGTGVSTGMPLLRRWRALSTDRLCDLLDRAGCERFMEKSAWFRTLLRSEGDEQALYSRSLEALGYSRNRAPFLELAKRLPWRVLMEIGRNTHQDQRASTMEGLLMETGGAAREHQHRDTDVPIGLVRRRDATCKPARPSHRRSCKTSYPLHRHRALARPASSDRRRDVSGCAPSLHRFRL